MFDVVVLAEGDAVSAARTLSTLVEGVVQGHLRRLVLASPDEHEDLAALADEAGCRLEAGVPLGALWPRLAAHISTPHVLVIAAGTLLAPGWTNLLRTDGLRQGALHLNQSVFFMPEERLARLKLRAALALRRPVPVRRGAIVPIGSLVRGALDGTHVRLRGQEGHSARMARVVVGR